jgi:hypothetical protein
MLEKDLSKRYKHASEVVMDLEEAVDKQKFKRDGRMLRDYFKDPQAGLEKFNVEQLEKILSKPPPPESGDAEAQMLYHARVLYLNPSDERAREEYDRLKKHVQRFRVTPDDGPSTASGERSSASWDEVVETTTSERRAADADPNAEYQVILEAINLAQETPASFALKLSMRIRSPLPRVTSLVKKLPARVGGHLSSQKANKLASILEELGGIPRVVVHTQETEPVEEQKPVPKEDSTKRRKGESRQDEENFDQGTKTQTRAAPSTTAGPKASIICPECGWEGDADARFCPICSFVFEKVEKPDLALLGKKVQENPLRLVGGEKISKSSFLNTLSGLPNNIKYGGLGALIVLLLLIIFGR